MTHATSLRRWKHVMIDLAPHHLETVRRILAENVPNCEVRAFGSRAKWEGWEYSDLDLAVVRGDEQDWRTIPRLKAAFEESDLPIRIDVLDWHVLAEDFRKIIESDYVVVQPGPRPASWRELMVGEFAPFRYGKSLPASRRVSSGSVPVYGSNGVTGYHDSSLTNGPTVIIGRKGTAGAVHYSSVPCWPIDTTFFVSGRDAELVRFKYYALSALGLEGMNADSAVPGLNREAAHARELRVPDEPEQRAIVGVLGALDDKIELNRRMSETLEEMARALFRSWFVDFDPVRAKAEGRPTGLPPDLDVLFPSSFEESELGEIPAGWQVRRLGDLAETVRGRSYRSSELTESDTALVTRKSFARGGGYRPDGLKPYVGEYKIEQIIEPGELVIACTDVTQSADVVGRPAVVPADRRFATLVASLDTLILRPLGSALNLIPFLYHLMSTPSFIQYTYARTSGTTVLHLSREEVPAFEFPAPPPDLMHVFATLITPAYNRMLDSSTESSMLVAQRDALLPRLLSGKVRVGRVKGSIRTLA